MKIPYRFSTLRYVHDPVTQEFVNVGVVVYSPEAHYLKSRCSSSYRRISQFFLGIEGPRFRQLVDYIERSINQAGVKFRENLPLDQPQSLEAALARVLPVDDSALQFGPAGAGITEDLDGVLADTFARCVERYAKDQGQEHRNDEQVWRVFNAPLERRRLSPKLEPKVIAAPDYEYEFDHAWKNGVWHLYEPVSLDLLDAKTITDKANRWLGRATTLQRAPEPFRLHLLVGKPSAPGLAAAAMKAENILKLIPGDREIVREQDAERLAEAIAREMQAEPQ